MEKPPLYVVSTLVILLLSFGLSPTFVTNSNMIPELQAGKAMTAAEEDGALIIRVSEDEAVMNTSADTNYHGITNYGGLWVGLSSAADLTRSYLKFDLSHIPEEIRFQSAEVNLFMSGPAVPSEDIPIGVYLANNNWTEQSITWNTQPDASETPASIISTPESPDTFIVGNWYSWDITDYISQKLAGDKTLSLLLRGVDEHGPASTFSAFAEDEYYHFNASYVTIRYSGPSISELSVEGIGGGTLLEYIQNDEPSIHWQFSDADMGETQYNYEAQAFNNSECQGMPLYDDKSGVDYVISDKGEETGVAPWGISNEMRFQYKFPASNLSQSGTLDRISFCVNTSDLLVNLENLVVSVACTNEPGDLGTDFDANFGSCAPVIIKHSELYEAEVVDGRLVIDAENVFVISQNLDLIIEIRYTNSSATGLLSLFDSSPGSGSIAYTWGPNTYESDTAIFAESYCYNVKLHFMTSSTEAWNHTTTSSIPFNLASNSTGTVQFKYNATTLEGPGFIDTIFFHVNDTFEDAILENVSVVLAETTLVGSLSNDLQANFNGAESVEVLNRESYRLKNRGGLLVIDITSSFYYTAQKDLLVQISWDCQNSNLSTFLLDSGGYAAWNYVDNITHNSNSSWAPQIGLDYRRPHTEANYDGAPLIEGQANYLRIRVMDSVGSWSDWDYISFTYQPLSEGPELDMLLINPDQITLGESVQVSVTVTHFLGVNQVLISIGGINQTMSQELTSYSYNWTPQSAGTVSFTIYAESVIGTWSTISGSVQVQQITTTSTSTTTTNGGADTFLLLLSIGSIGVLVIGGAGIAIRRRKGSIS